MDLRDPSRRLVNVILVGQGSSLIVETEPVSEDQLESHPVYNPVLASLVTSYGRRHLFQALKKCGCRALYCDTVRGLPFLLAHNAKQQNMFQDSIIYVSDPTQVETEPKVDPHGLLGGWVDEIKPGHFISVGKILAGQEGKTKCMFFDGGVCGQRP